MKLVALVCPSCGGSVEFSEDKRTITCKYCGQELHLQEELDKWQDNNSAGISSYVERAYDLIRQEKFVQAEAITKEALKAYPYAGRLHLALLLCELNVSNPSKLASYGKDYTSSDNFKNCLLFMSLDDQKDLLSLVEQNKTALPKTVDLKSKYNIVDTSEKGVYTQTMIDAILNKMDVYTKYGVIYKNGQDDDFNKNLDELTKNSFVEECGYIHDSLKKEVREQWFKDIVNNHKDEMDAVKDLDEMKAKLPEIFKCIVKEYDEKSEAEHNAMLREMNDAEEKHNAEEIHEQQKQNNNKKEKNMGKGKGKTTVGKIIRLIGFICIPVGLAIIIVGASMINTNEAGAIGMAIPGAIILIGGLILFFIGRTYLRGRCEKCGAKMAGCEYEYITKSAKERYSSGSHQYFVDYVFSVRAVCPECGTVKTFDVKRTLSEDQNPEAAIRSYCQGLFKH